ncbi:MAG: FAD-binding oxidoreductase [Candidatus Omnitrophica bacterium]|nr:FAD-binding oxidoreductase [Candidatus Omnitrophota bacterium]
MDKNIIQKLAAIVGEKGVISAKDLLENYSHDEFPLPEIWKLPDAAVKPRNAEEVSEILKLANKEKIPVTPRGGGTGLCGGCVPQNGGIVLLFDNMNKVLEVDPDNFMVTAQAGVMLRDLYAQIEKEGFFFPPHPGDETAMVGGVIATNAGGARAVKYGTIRNFVRGIEVVLPGGDIINLGGKFIKNSTGFNLLQLFIGSEGTLGVITKAVISFLAAPKETATLVVPYDTIQDAIGTVPAIMKGKIVPLAIEFIEEDAIAITEKHLSKKWPVRDAKACLVIILDAASREEVDRLTQAIADIALKNKAKDVFIADTKTREKEILDFRSSMYEALKPNLIETLDIAVPVSEIAAHVEAVHRIEKEQGLWIPTYGHAGDGNVHAHIMKLGLDQKIKKDWQKIYPVVRKLIHEDAKKRGGMISGEHGIGLIKREYMLDFLGPKQIEIMRSIKSILDPNNILNPGKIV